VGYEFMADQVGWIKAHDLSPAELVKLADIVGMVDQWKGGARDELLPSTSTRFRDRFRRELTT